MIQPPHLTTEIAKAWRLGTAPFRLYPSFVLPGAPKCGTSTLYDTLCTHPQVRRGYRKEPTNFIHYPGSRLRCRMNYPLWVPQLFVGNFICGDASVEYFTHPQAAECVAEILPGAKLIFLFRDPVDRAWSDYQMFVKAGTETQPFRDVVMRSIDWLSSPDLKPLIESAAQNAFSPIRYVLNGLYEQHLQHWLKWYSREQSLILISEDYFQQSEATMEKVLEFLQLNPFRFSEEKNISRLGGYSDTMDDDTRQSLHQFFAPHNVQLSQFLGRSLPWSAP